MARSENSPVKYQTSFGFFSDRATNPANRDEDVDDISKFCDQVNKELEGPQTAVKLLAHKIQSPQEREALYALAVSCKRLNNHNHTGL